MVDVPIPGFQKTLDTGASLKSECHAITNKYPETASLLQQVYKALGDIENHVRCTPAKVRENSEFTSIVNSSEKNRANFCKDQDEKPLFSAVYSMYIITVNELKAILKVSVQAGQNI
jgi:hypothetical protein